MESLVLCDANYRKASTNVNWKDVSEFLAYMKARGYLKEFHEQCTAPITTLH